MQKKNEGTSYPELDLHEIGLAIRRWAVGKPVNRVSLYRCTAKETPQYVLVAELPSLPDKKLKKRSIYKRERRVRLKNLGDIFDIHQDNQHFKKIHANIPKQYPTSLEVSEDETAVINAYNSTDEGCSHLLPDLTQKVYGSKIREQVSQLLDFCTRTVWINIPSGTDRDNFFSEDSPWVFLDTHCVLFDSADNLNQKGFEIKKTKEEDEQLSKNMLSKTNNFFIRESHIWHIGFEGQTSSFHHLDGFLYIDYLLKNPGKSHSSICLYQAAKPADSALMAFDRAAAEGLNIKTKSKIVSAEKPATRKALLDKYKELSTELKNAESELERSEIEAEMNKIIESVKSEDKMPDPLDQKAQSNVRKHINRAIAAIEKGGMKSLADNLRDAIKPDGQYGYIYRGPSW